MTPLQQVLQGRVIRIARVPRRTLKKSTVQLIASGPYKGIVINKAANGKSSDGFRRKLQ